MQKLLWLNSDFDIPVGFAEQSIRVWKLINLQVEPDSFTPRTVILAATSKTHDLTCDAHRDSSSLPSQWA